MTTLPLAWTLLTVSLWTAGSSQILLQEPVKVLYPAISTQENIECNCINSCDSVYWFRRTPHHSDLQFLGKCNNAERVNFGADVDQARFKLSKRGNTAFVLRIDSVKAEDAGTYSCILKDKSGQDTWRPGTVLRPGETPPTAPPKPKPKPPVKSVCRCSPKKKPTHDGCDYLVLWPLVGATAGLALALICTLYYFSRLPKKCRHNFVKMRQMP
ncbi:signal-regulatory protein gamma [Hippoglossus hippoglossus]|uniref:CD8 beta n=1 Tax=Hippoglossus hippoglossus TaxID=8267 RepID=B7SQ84_HIPHI|nr:signal-regulatory protein gamma [Hippoglossus hippoglossus]ACF04750.1 CD8 beta [Hippoglossus hippoglossus]ACF04752.1 CD8 beta [Hippoglossus hippoglossus]